ncbi:MAG: hypothetical protein A9183_07025 [Dehalococcoides mccartyi]|uniref:hypothetical protein n=1 Tax=Dehalococcoides mccartyi TaxID=61435 RepID=UPI000804E49A|nr:hypothetical protein [Dehalococcoides mccartyi]OBW62580.1 MAG: hypothetical protein A9183_07025 [Dehalococcoides mccartyi]
MVWNDNETDRQIEQIINILEKQPELLNTGLNQPLKFHAREANLAVGQAQLMLVNEQETELFVLEIVPAEATAEDVGRLLAYVEWLGKTLLNIPVQQELSGQPNWYRSGSFKKLAKIQGIMLAHSFSEASLCAANACPNLFMRKYAFSLKITPADSK